MAVGVIEPQLYQELLDKLGIDDPMFDEQMDRNRWPALKDKLTVLFKTRTLSEWTTLLQDGDTCFAPVLSMAEAPLHPHNQARRSFVKVGKHLQAAPAPRFSRAVPETPTPAPRPGADTVATLSHLLNLSPDQITQMQREGVIL